MDNEKIEIIKKWLDENRFKFVDNFFIENQTFIKANGSSISTDMLIVIKTENPIEKDDMDLIKIAAYNMRRRIWIADVNVEEKSLEWEYI